jgi:hypothetical protein
MRATDRGDAVGATIKHIVKCTKAALEAFRRVCQVDTGFAFFFNKTNNFVNQRMRAFEVQNPGRTRIEFGVYFGHRDKFYLLSRATTSTMCVLMELSIEAYASIAAELDTSGDDRNEILARHKLDEEQWDDIDTEWQERLSADLDGDSDGVPQLLATYTAAYQQAQRVMGPPISLVEFAHVIRFFQASGDLQAALTKVGVTLTAYLRSNEYWMQRLTEDPDEEQRFHEALRREETTGDRS